MRPVAVISRSNNPQDLTLTMTPTSTLASTATAIPTLSSVPPTSKISIAGTGFKTLAQGGVVDPTHTSTSTQKTGVIAKKSGNGVITLVIIGVLALMFL